MKAYKEWLKENEERLLESYAFDVHELLNLSGNDFDYLKDIKSFKDWSKIVYETEKDDKEYDKGGDKK